MVIINRKVRVYEEKYVNGYGRADIFKYFFFDQLVKVNNFLEVFILSAYLLVRYSKYVHVDK